MDRRSEDRERPTGRTARTLLDSEDSGGGRNEPRRDVAYCAWSGHRGRDWASCVQGAEEGGALEEHADSDWGKAELLRHLPDTRNTARRAWSSHRCTGFHRQRRWPHAGVHRRRGPAWVAGAARHGCNCRGAAGTYVCRSQHLYLTENIIDAQHGRGSWPWRR